MAESGAAFPVPPGSSFKVKLGKSFSDRSNNAFHTITYDFKPLSVDYSKPAKMRVSGDEVIVSVPNTQAESSEDVTQFRGGKKPCQKECVLIINTKLGEATLERVSSMVQLKVLRTRKDKIKPTSKPPDRSISPLPNPPASGGGSSLKVPSKLASSHTGRAPSPAFGKKPPKKKKKLEDGSSKPEKKNNVSTIKKSDASSLKAQAKSSDKPKPPKLPVTTNTVSQTLSSSSDSEMEEVVSNIPSGHQMVRSMPSAVRLEPPSRKGVNNGVVVSENATRGDNHQSTSCSSDSSDGSSDSSSESDSADSFAEEIPPKQPLAPQRSMSMLHNDLQLSDASSESDSE